MTLRDLVRGIWSPPGREEFAQHLARVLDGVGIDGEIEIGAEDMRLILEGNAGQFSLMPLYEQYCQAQPWRRQKLLDDFSVTAGRNRAGIPADFNEAKEHLRPVIRDAFLYEALSLEMEADGTGPLKISIKNMAQRYCIGLVYDWPESMCTVDDEQLATWGVDFDAALEVACDNLHARTEGGMQELTKGLYLSPWQDSYDAARLLLPSAYRDVSVQGDLIAFVPHRDCLIMTGSEDIEGLRRAAELVEEQIKNPRPISALPLIGHHLCWDDFSVADGHPCADILHRQRAMELTGCYEQQQQLLMAVHAKRGEDLHVAHYNAIQDPDSGRIFSYSVWARDTPTLLPKTDEVVLVEKLEQEAECEVVARLSWDDLAEFCPAMTKSLSPSLPRYKVEQFPAPDEAIWKRCLELI